jgi:hypothetical protein
MLSVQHGDADSAWIPACAGTTVFTLAGEEDISCSLIVRQRSGRLRVAILGQDCAVLLVDIQGGMLLSRERPSMLERLAAGCEQSRDRFGPGAKNRPAAAARKHVLVILGHDAPDIEVAWS